MKDLVEELRSELSRAVKRGDYEAIEALSKALQRVAPIAYGYNLEGK